MSDWKPIDTAPHGRVLLLFFPAETRRGVIRLSEMIKAERYPVSYPRKPTHWCEIPKVPQVEPIRDDS